MSLAAFMMVCQLASIPALLMELGVSGSPGGSLPANLAKASATSTRLDLFSLLSILFTKY